MPPPNKRKNSKRRSKRTRVITNKTVISSKSVMEEIESTVDDNYIRSPQLGRVISKVDSREMEVDLGGTTTNTTPVSTVTPSRESSQQTKKMKEKKKKRRRKKKKELNGKMKTGEQSPGEGHLVWKSYIPPTRNPFVITEEEYNSNNVNMDKNRKHDINDSTLLIPSMSNLRKALTKADNFDQDNVYTLEERASDIWRLNRHFNISRGTIPRGNCVGNNNHFNDHGSSNISSNSTFTHNEGINSFNYHTDFTQNSYTSELMRHLEILHRGNIGNILPFTSKKYGQMDTFLQNSKSNDSDKSC